MPETLVSARVSLVKHEQAPLGAAAAYANGDPGPIVASLAQVPEILEVSLPFVSTVLGPTSLDLRTKEIVILRTSALLACRFCVATHSVAALDSGLSWTEMTSLRDEASVSELPLSDAELALVRWVDAVATGMAAPDDLTYAHLREHWDEPAVIELTLLVGATMMLNRYATALGLPPAVATLERLAVEAAVVPSG